MRADADYDGHHRRDEDRPRREGFGLDVEIPRPRARPSPLHGRRSATPTTTRWACPPEGARQPHADLYLDYATTLTASTRDGTSPSRTRPASASRSTGTGSRTTDGLVVYEPRPAQFLSARARYPRRDSRRTVSSPISPTEVRHEGLLRRDAGHRPSPSSSWPVVLPSYTSFDLVTYNGDLIGLDRLPSSSASSTA